MSIRARYIIRALRDSGGDRLSNVHASRITFADTAKITGHFPRTNKIYVHAQTVNTRSFFPPSATAWVQGYSKVKQVHYMYAAR